jgi:hypothetical protein
MKNIICSCNDVSNVIFLIITEELHIYDYLKFGRPTHFHVQHYFFFTVNFDTKKRRVHELFNTSLLFVVAFIKAYFALLSSLNFLGFDFYVQYTSVIKIRGSCLCSISAAIGNQVNFS